VIRDRFPGRSSLQNQLKTWSGVAWRKSRKLHGTEPDSCSRWKRPRKALGGPETQTKHSSLSIRFAAPPFRIALPLNEPVRVLYQNDFILLQHGHEYVFQLVLPKFALIKL